MSAPATPTEGYERDRWTLTFRDPELESAAIRDTTNLAARLQTFAEPGHVVISERTLELLGPADVEPLGAPALKGKTLPVAVFDLRALHEVPVEA